MNQKCKITICPDYDAYLWNEEKESMDLKDLNDIKGKAIILDELDSWSVEIKPIILLSEAGKPYVKDWEDYHRLKLGDKVQEVINKTNPYWYDIKSFFRFYQPNRCYFEKY